MCIFGNKNNQPVTPQALPAPAPTPAPTPTEVSPATDEARRQRETERLKKGVASTIKTGPQGITGAGPDLATPSAAGVLYPTMGTKKTLG